MSRRARAAGLLAALVGGALVGCSLPPLLPWPVAVVGVALLVWSLHGAGTKRRFVIGLLYGLGQFSIGLAWATQFDLGGYAALVVAEALFVAVALSLVPGSSLVRTPAVAGALVLAEWARDRFPFGGMPLGSSAFSQVGGPLAFAARLGGALLVIAVMVLAGGGLAETARALSKRGGGGLAGGLSALLAAAAIAGAGYVSSPSIPPGTQRISVALVQGGGRRGLDALQVPSSTVLRAALEETAKIKGHPQLILWPEDVVGMGATRFAGSAAEADLEAVARRYSSTVIAGVTEDVGNTRFLNEVVAFSPSGRLVARFEKVHRVPFGEYVPYRSFFKHLANLDDIPRDAVVGHGSGMIATPAGRFAVLISYEVFFSSRGLSGVRAGGKVILVPTNTSSYSNGQAPAQEIAASRLQALEEGRYVLQAAPTGYSAVITSNGKVLKKSRLSRPSLIEARVPLLSGSTPYEQGGDLPVVLAALAALGLGWLLRERRL